VLRKIFGAKKDEVIDDLGRLYDEKLYGLPFSQTNLRVIKSRRM
jgi:hypothetical protein